MANPANNRLHDSGAGWLTLFGTLAEGSGSLRRDGRRLPHQRVMLVTLAGLPSRSADCSGQEFLRHSSAQSFPVASP
jgi:hypothetical protein